jgi:type IV secretory pathway TraG/TraD family ATPase VirD4
VQDFRRGQSVVLIDGKGDPELVRRFLKESHVAAESEGVWVFDPMNPRSCSINPLGSGTPQQITDRILSSFEFPDPYYKGVQADALLTVVSLIRELETEVTFIRIEKVLTDMDHLSELVNRSSHERVKIRARALIRQKEETRLQNLSGILTQLSPFTAGEIAKLVNGNTEGGDGKVISLVDSLVHNPERRTATLILLPTLIYQEVAKTLGRMLLQELAYCVGMRAAGTGKRFPFTPVFLDEFSSFAYQGFEQILNKARSSGVAFHLSHQSMGDLESVSPQFAKIINTNTNVKCLLGLNDPDTAEFFARHLGTFTTEKFTERTEEEDGLFSTTDKRTGAKSVRETETYKIHPNILKSMTAGHGVLHVPTELGAMTEEVQFHSLSDLNQNLMGGR